MQRVHKRRFVAAVIAAGVAAGSLAISESPLEAGKPPKINCRGRNDTRREMLRCVKLPAILDHLRAFQRIADINGGNRAAGTPGYDASADYVERRLEGVGYEVTRQEFEFTSYRASELVQTSAPATTYVYAVDFLENAFDTGTPEGTATGTLVPVDVAGASSGCEPEDFAGFPAGSIALLKRGTCGFSVKAVNADAAGAAGAIVYNDGAAPDRFGLISMIGPAPGLDIPVVFATFDVGNALAMGGPRTVRVTVDGQTLPTTNVFAELEGANENRVIMAGAHLDSVIAGEGINDNGTGSAALLETAIQMARNRPRNTVRFAWWGAEEEGLLGSEFYIDSLDFDEQLDIRLYLNYDMVGSPNFVRFIYDGDGSAFGTPGPIGSDRIEELFENFFAGRGLATEPTAFNGRSDYGPFIAVGIPAGGLFTGAEGIKTAAQQAIFGGTAGEAYDSCYHEECDDSRNINRRVLNQNADAIAFAALRYSKARGLPGDPGARIAAARLAESQSASFRGHGPAAATR